MFIILDCLKKQLEKTFGVVFTPKNYKMLKDLENYQV